MKKHSKAKEWCLNYWKRNQAFRSKRNTLWWLALSIWQDPESGRRQASGCSCERFSRLMFTSEDACAEFSRLQRMWEDISVVGETSRWAGTLERVHTRWCANMNEATVPRSPLDEERRQSVVAERGRISFLRDKCPDRLFNLRKSTLNTHTQEHKLNSVGSMCLSVCNNNNYWRRDPKF